MVSGRWVGGSVSRWVGGSVSRWVGESASRLSVGRLSVVLRKPQEISCSENSQEHAIGSVKF